MARTKTKVDLETTAIAEYWHKIEAGDITACKEIKAVYKHLYAKLFTDQIDGFHFDYELSQRPIEFAEKFCGIVKIRGFKLFKAELFQRAMLEAIFGFVDKNGLRQYQEVLYLVGRKNGKSYIAAIIALYMLLCDGESESEIYTAASTKDQAKIIWDMCGMIISKSPELQRMLKKTISHIRCPANGGIIKPVAADSGTLDGLNSHMVILDECHAQKTADLYNVLVDSTAAREQPLTLICTTQGFVREGLLDSKLTEYGFIIDGYEDAEGYKDPRRLPIIYKLDDKSEWTNMNAWLKANPGLGTIRSFDKLANDVDRAKSNPAQEKNLLTKFFDIPELGTDHFFTVEEITNTATFDVKKLKPRYGIGGFDLSQVNDLTSAVVIFQVPDDPIIYCLTMSWMPEEVLEKHIKTDKVPYDIWYKKGWLRLCPGNQINHKDIHDWFLEVQREYDIYLWKVGFDRYSASYLKVDMEKTFGPSVMIEVAQGAKTLSIPLQMMKTTLENHQINYNNNQLMKWCLANVKVRQDDNGNYNTVKNRNGNIRDDAALALLDALVVYFDKVKDYHNII